MPFRGFNLLAAQAMGISTDSHVVYQPYDLKLYQAFKSWNLNSVIYNVMWYDIEKDGARYAEYDQALLGLLGEQIDLARAAGLKTFVSSRVSYSVNGVAEPYWTNTDGYGADHVCGLAVDHTRPDFPYESTQYAPLRDRYATFLAMLAKTFPNSGVCMWHFPYHNWGYYLMNTIRRTNFNLVCSPKWLKALRNATNQPLIFVPLKQSMTKPMGQTFPTTGGEFEFLEPYDIPDVIYGVDGFPRMYDSILTSAVTATDVWNYDKAPIDAAYSLTERWQVLTKKPIVGIELHGLNIHGSLEAMLRPVRQDRVDLYKAIMEKFQKNNWNWFYWNYSNVASSYTGFATSPLEKDSTRENMLFNPELLNIFKSYGSPSEVATSGIPPLLIGGVLLLGALLVLGGGGKRG